MKAALAIALACAITAAHADVPDSVLVEMTQRIIVHDLKDPDSAHFRDVRVSSPPTIAPKVIVCGEVNAKNSYGGYTGFKRFFLGRAGVVMEGSRSDFAEQWAKLCAVTEDTK
jgi:hypothetical protein